MFDELQVSEEFLAEEQQLCQTMPKSKKGGGPYSKQDKSSRRSEVYRYHFEYGYSARKISELVKINRNTINSDIKYWYSRISKNNSVQNPESAIVITMERLDLQRTRLREYLDKVKEISNKMSIEKMICDIDVRIAHVHQKLTDSFVRSYDNSIDSLNTYLKSNNKDERFFTFRDKISVSKKSFEKIEKIIVEDRKSNLWERQN